MYILFATSSQKELDDFVEDVVANKFDLTTTHVLSSMRCYRNLNSEGYKCIFVVDSWSNNKNSLNFLFFGGKIYLCSRNVAEREYFKFVETA